MSAVLADPQVTPRFVPLSAAVEVNPKLDRTALTDDTQVSFVPMAAVGAANGHINVSTVRPYAEVKKGYTHFRNGDVLFAKVTPCMENGKMAVARQLQNGVGFGSTEFHVLRPRDGVDAQYIYHFVSSQTYRKEAARHMTGAVGLRRVPSTFLESSEILLPHIDEQHRIVAEIEKQFSRLDEAVANLQRVKANLKHYKASVLKAAVEGRLVETEASIAHREGRTYETGEQLLTGTVAERKTQRTAKGKLKDASTPVVKNLSQLTDGWAWACVEEVGRLQLGRQRAPKYHAGANMRPYLRVQNVFEDRIDLSDVMEMEFSEADFERFELHNGDVLLNEGQSPEFLGRPAIYRTQLPGACFTNTLIRFQAYGCALPEFALIVFRHCMHSGRFAKESNITTNIAHLSLGRLATVEFPVPPIAEQQRIVFEFDRQMSIVCEVEAEVDANLKRAQTLRQATLAKVFSTC